MGFRKVVLAVSLLLVCFMLAVQSAKADRIIIVDNTAEGTVTVQDLANLDGSGPFDTVTGFPCTNEPNCQFNLTRTFVVFGSTISATPNIAGFLSSYLLAESTVPPVSLTTPISDSLNTSIAANNSEVQLHFGSDNPATEANPTSFCPLLNNTPNCNDFEGGQPNIVAGTITWTVNGQPAGNSDTVQILSDIAGPESSTVPEPASLILFGSGLAMAGGFLRRRLGGAIGLA